MNVISRTFLVGLALLVAGCASLPGSNFGDTFTAESYLNQSIEGDDFNSSLAREYQALAARSASPDVNWMDATAYINKSKAASAGGAAPWTPAELGLGGDGLQAEYDNAVAVIAANKDARPAECAKAQAMWDQYLELTSQGGVYTSVDDAQAMLASALEACGPSESQFTIYFGFDRFDLTAQAQTVVGNIIAAAQSIAAPLLSIVGHTDTSGSVAYNQGLSERRANTVASAIAAGGVDPSVMTVAGRSETELAVPTADGVREPRNRRVEVNISSQ